MKAIMRARLIDGAVENNKVTISVINLGDKQNSASPTSLRIGSSIALRKINEIMHLINEKNKITMIIELNADLLSVSDIKEVKINGIDIDFSEVNHNTKRQKTNQKYATQARNEAIVFFVGLGIALFVAFMIISFISRLH